ncbi:MAG: glycoside hydrolase family 97 protein [Prolixibacteraceae bacterium]|jgi:alpha-glucosidase|nr:glycoside hydrolase family 97 protein [Prolixibacteraceae bacterium]
MKSFPFFLIVFCSLNLFAKEYSVQSPDGNTKVTVSVTDGIRWSGSYAGSPLFTANEISVALSDRVLGNMPHVVSAKQSSNATVETAVVGIKSTQIRNEYNELDLKFKGDYSVVFRIFNEGIAYRFETRIKTPLTVVDEKAVLNFAGNFSVLFPEEESLISHYERSYLDEPVAAIAGGRFCSLPALVKVPGNIKIGITEADLYDYPCLFLEGTGQNTLVGKFPKVILEAVPSKKGADRDQTIVKEADYIAQTDGTRNFPWRVFMLSQNDVKLIENQMVYLLSRPGNMENTLWIKPGQVAWDWWNDNNIYGVDFKSGLNTETYKYYIDFAADYGLEYIILDEGWSITTTNLLKPNNELNLEELVSYAKSKNVGVILWLLWGPLDREMEAILDQFKAWGVQGIKVDFMQRADQYMVNFYERAARECAKRELLIDYHGAFKPAGMLRAYPNIVNHEGLKGMENNKWSDLITPAHDVTLPFTRMLAGPIDFTPGAMLNTQEKDYAVSWSNPMSQGTRCHQVAMYVVYEAPLQMLSDNPSNLRKESETVEFISKIPTVWDETVGLEGKVGEYIAIARKKDNVWYIGAMNNWDEREMEIDLSFLGEGTYHFEIMQDGINANKSARDYKKLSIEKKSTDKLKIRMAKGGGWVAICTKK